LQFLKSENKFLLMRGLLYLVTYHKMVQSLLINTSKRIIACKML
jgi:hypothetical protein